MKEQVNPDYYKNKKIETYEAIKSQLTPEEIIGGHRWMILKYMMRMGEKHGGSLAACRMDISKAHWYAEKLIQNFSDLESQGYEIKQADNVSDLFKENKK